MVTAQLTTMLIEMQIEKVMLIRFRTEIRILFGIGLGATLFILWQRIWLCYIHALRFCKKLSLKVTDKFTGQRKHHNSTAFTQHHGYFWLLLARFTRGTRIKIKEEQSGKFWKT